MKLDSGDWSWRPKANKKAGNKDDFKEYRPKYKYPPRTTERFCKKCKRYVTACVHKS